jgi:Ala-tRNA(Pro) deacylase
VSSVDRQENKSVGDLFAQICKLLDDCRSDYHVLNHPPCRTSAESANARAHAGFPEAVGAKALLVKLNGTPNQDFESIEDGGHFWFDVFVLPGPSRLDSQAIKTLFTNVRRFRFATPEEMLERCGVVPGSMPPFAHSIFPQLNRLFVDESLARYDWLGFNAASLERSVVVRSSDYFRAANPAGILNFAVI